MRRWQRSISCGTFWSCACPSCPCPTSPSWMYPLSDAWTSCETCEPWSESWTPWQSPISSLGAGCSTGYPWSFPGHPVVQAPYQMRRECHLWGSPCRPSDVLSAAGPKEIPLSGIFCSRKQCCSACPQYGLCMRCHCFHCISKTDKMTTFSPSCCLCLTLVPGAGASDCPCCVVPAGNKPQWLSPLQKPSGDWDALEPTLPSRVPSASRG